MRLTSHYSCITLLINYKLFRLCIPILTPTNDVQYERPNSDLSREIPPGFRFTLHPQVVRLGIECG